MGETTLKTKHVLHMMPGTGKTWLCENFPNLFADGDILYEKAFPGKWVGRVHLIPLEERKAALQDTGRTVLTNDHEVAELSVVHLSVDDYIAAGTRRGDIPKSQLRKWFNELMAHSRPIQVPDPQSYAVGLATNWSAAFVATPPNQLV